MKSYRQTRIAVITLFALLAMPLALAAQDDAALAKKAQHHHYKLIDVGTFGGPQSYLNGFGTLYVPTLINNRGQLVGWADTSQPDPFAPLCFDPDCFTAHAFLWQDGERTDLGLLPGGASSAANWISANGLVAGLAENGQIDPLIGIPEVHAVLWQNGAITDLGTLEGGYESISNAVNREGQVVGLFANDVPDQNSMFGGGYQARAFLWQNGVMQDLGTLGGTDAQAFLINERGQVVGLSYTSSSPGACGSLDLGLPLATDPFIWEEGKGMTDLGNFGGTCTLAFQLNNRGEVVGFSFVAGDMFARPFLWSKGTMHDLGGSLGGRDARAFVVNEHGEAAGAADLAGDVLFHAVLWRRIGELTDLGVVGNDQCSATNWINAKGQVVGVSTSDCVNFTNSHSFLWENGSMVDLHTLIQTGSQLSFVNPLDINDRGEIVIYALDAVGNEHAVLLIPCDDDHPNVEGCDYSMVDADTAATAVPAAPATKVPSPLIQGNPAFRGPMNPMLRRFGRPFGTWYRRMGIPTPLKPTSVTPAGGSPQTGTEGSPERSPEIIPSASSDLQVDDLISARDRAEVTAGLGLTSDTAENTLSCPVPVCSPYFHRNFICGVRICYKAQFEITFSAYDLRYKRYCRYIEHCHPQEGSTP